MNGKKIVFVVLFALMMAVSSVFRSASAAEAAPYTKNGDVMILYTSDIHCGVDQGFGLAGLQQIRDTLEAQGYITLLVDDGDAIQGEILGTVSQGEAMIRLMNAMHYDAAIPGSHDQIAVIRVTGQQILDGLEWGARSVPDAYGGFLQVSGLSYTIDVSVPPAAGKTKTV